jgi:hypothetical protein
LDGRFAAPSAPYNALHADAKAGCLEAFLTYRCMK